MFGSYTIVANKINLLNLMKKKHHIYTWEIFTFPKLVYPTAVFIIWIILVYNLWDWLYFNDIEIDGKFDQICEAYSFCFWNNKR